jgi:hypothetical protein
MNLKKDITNIILSSLQPLLQKISDETDITIEQLKYLEYSTPKTCRYMFKRGANKRCESSALDNGFCSKHQKSAIIESSTIKTTKPKTEPKTTKTKQEIVQMMLTATPEKITRLITHQLGFIHESTNIIFERNEDDYTAIGVYLRSKLTKLSYLETEICEKMGWRYIERDDLESENESE